jgi:Bacterial SH3 domain
MFENQNPGNFLGSLAGGNGPLQMGSRTVTVESDEDQLSKLLVDFKAGTEPQTTQWIRLASLVASHSFSCDIVIRALGPKEAVASGSTSLDKLGVAIARKTGAKYCPSRLQRISTGTTNIFMDPASGDRYTFDKSFLPPKSRILVVGDPETSSTTFETIKSGILETLPEAEVKFFTLAWLGEHVKGGHLDAKYFLSHASPASVLQQGGNGEMPQPTLTRENKTRKGKNSSPKPAAKSQKTKEPTPQAPKPTSISGDQKSGVRAPNNIRSRLLVLVAAFVIIGLGLMVIISRTWIAGRGGINSGSQDLFSAQREQSVSVKTDPAPEPPPPAPKQTAPVVQKKPQGPTGVITVPKAGLRSGPSLTSKPVRATVKNNERVTILKRSPSTAGPDWVQIETKSGTVGWVWANVVRESKSRN